MASVRKREWEYNGAKKTAWVVNYTDQDGKRRLKTFEKKKDADAYRAKVEVEIEAGLHTPATSKRTVKQVAEEYIKNLESRLADGRISLGYLKCSKSRIDKHVVPFFGQRMFDELNLEDFEGFYDHLVTNAGNAPFTAKEIIAQVATMEKFAAKRRIPTKYAAREMVEELRGVKRGKIDTFTREQAIAILEASKVRERHRQARNQKLIELMVHLAAICGMRLGEITGLKLPHVNLERRVLEVRHSMQPNGELKAPKTKSGLRDIPMPDAIHTMFKEWLERYYIHNDRELVFLTYNGGPMHRLDIHRQWVDLLKRSGVGENGPSGTRYHFHALRHFAASWMVDNNLPVTDVAHILGHSKFDMTLQVYAHPLRDQRERHNAMQNLAPGLQPSARQESDKAA